MRIMTFIRSEEDIDYLSKVDSTIWYRTCNELIDKNIYTGKYAVFAEIPDSIYQDWLNNGYFSSYPDTDIPTSGCLEHLVSITRLDNKLYVKLIDGLYVNTYNELVIACMKRDIHVEPISYVTEEMRGWAK